MDILSNQQPHMMDNNLNGIPEQDREDQARKIFLEELTTLMQEIGKAITKMPVMGYKELDLYQFYQEVQNNGGFAQVTEKVGTWSKIWKKLDNYDASITDASFRLKKNYERFLLDYEYKCFPERKQQQKLKPSKGKRSRSNSASSKDKNTAQQIARQQQQQIEAAHYQLKQLEVQQQLESQQLVEVQQYIQTSSPSLQQSPHQSMINQSYLHSNHQAPLQSGSHVHSHHNQSLSAQHQTQSLPVQTHEPIYSAPSSQNSLPQSIGSPQTTSSNLEVILPMNDDVISDTLNFDDDFRARLENEVKNIGLYDYVESFSPQLSKKIKPQDEILTPNSFDDSIDDQWNYNNRCAFGEEKKFNDEWNLNETSSMY